MNLLEIYRKIMLIRGFENKLDDLFKKGLISGTAHLSIGQEFVPVIVSQYLTAEDSVTSGHRGHAHAISKGLDIKKMLAEMMGRVSGYCQGKSGTQHLLSSEHKFYANGITGGMVPIAAGMALANKYFKRKQVVVSYLGDGGFNEGYVLEALNLCAVLKLPILLVCENNFYAMSTPIAISHAAEIHTKAAAFGITSAVVKDNDFRKLDMVASKFISEIRAGGGPRFIEVQTYRHKGHSKNDLNLYRKKEEEEAWFKKDVPLQIERELTETGAATAGELENIRTDITKMLDDCAAGLLNEKECSLTVDMH